MSYQTLLSSSPAIRVFRKVLRYRQELRPELTLILLVSAYGIFIVPVASGQHRSAYPPFTITTQTTAYDVDGQAVSTSTATQYHSASGDWRSVGWGGGFEVATLYRRGRGVYLSNGRTGLTVKISSHAPGCPLRTAEQLRRDPKFVRTEDVAGFGAYVLREKFPIGMTVETFFCPQLGGGNPCKRFSQWEDGRTIVEDPTSIITGEPSPSDVQGPDYPVIEQVPTFNKNLADSILSQPDPIYLQEVYAGGFEGRIYVSVVVDETGRVISAGSNMPVASIRDAAVAAAYQAWFSPTLCNGKPVISTGVISYKFVNLKLAKL